MFCSQLNVYKLKNKIKKVRMKQCTTYTSPAHASIEILFEKTFMNV